MGIRYSLNLHCLRCQSEDILKQLAPFVDEQTRSQIGDLSWQPQLETVKPTLIGVEQVDARGILGLTEASPYGIEALCFGLLVELESSLDDTWTAGHKQCLGQKGSFGCMWTSVDAGAEFVHVEMMAATRNMSYVLEHSQAVQQLWFDYSQACDALVSYVEMESCQALKIYPSAGDLSLPDGDTLCFCDDYHSSVDLYTNYIINENRI